MSRFARSTPIVFDVCEPRPRLSKIAVRAKPLISFCLLAGALAASQAAVAEEAYEYRWSAFACESEFPLADPEALGRDLESVRSGLFEATGLEIPNSPVSLTLFSSRKRYITFVSLEIRDARRQRGVFVNRGSRSEVYSFRQARLSETLRHESTHALLHSVLPYVPLWLDEGLASYFEAQTERQGVNDPRLKSLRWSLRIGWRPKLTTLESRQHFSDLDGGDYRHAWGWVHFLLNESDESRRLLQRYMRNIADGEPPQTMSAFLAVEMPDARERCIRFLSRR